ncbi:MAG: outer membrane beta-barrel protein [Ignavibacteria bacterium]
MKNTIAAVIFIIMSLPVISYSQFLTGFGIKGGATLSEQKIYLADGSTFYDTKPILGYNASIYAEIINNKAFSLVIEPGYEQRGHSIEFIRTDEFGNELGIDDWFFRTYYITIGALAKIRYSAKSVSPYLIIGPRLDLYLGYNISASNEEFYPWINEMKSPVHEDTKKTNYSLNFGAGMQFEKLFPFITFLEFNYSPAINSSYNNSFIKVKDNYYNLKLGINFIKKKTKSKK